MPSYVDELWYQAISASVGLDGISSVSVAFNQILVPFWRVVPSCGDVILMFNIPLTIVHSSRYPES